MSDRPAAETTGTRGEGIATNWEAITTNPQRIATIQRAGARAGSTNPPRHAPSRGVGASI
jgi:hypothetical protein